MRWEELGDDPCGVARAVSVIGDRWTLLILRESFYGVRRFDDFQGKLGITRHVLAERLKKLVELGVFAKTPYGETGARHEYRLTAKGLALFPVLTALASWAEAHVETQAKPAAIYRHRPCGHMLRAKTVCADCGLPLEARDVSVEVVAEGVA